MTDSRHLKKFKRNISATVSPILIKFGTAMHISHPNRTCDQMFDNLKIQESRIARGIWSRLYG